MTPYTAVRPPHETPAFSSLSGGGLYRCREACGFFRLAIQVCLLDYLCDPEPRTNGLKGLCLVTAKAAVRDSQLNVAKLRKAGQAVMTIF